ncbi:MAG: outer membrane protein assembly factor BamD [Chthoniobacterales bacterium]
MSSRVFILAFLLVFAFVLPRQTQAAVVFRPGEKAKYVTPGDEEINGNAQQLFQRAQEEENRGAPKRAIKAYRTLIRKFPRDTLAAGAAFQMAVLQEKLHDYLKAAESYRVVVERYPKTPHFNDAIESQFRIGEMYLGGEKVRFLGIPLKVSRDRATQIFAAIVRTAPYGKYTARAQFDIGLATEKEGAPDLAVAAYQAVVEKYPDDPIAADAQYQIGYLWFKAARSGVQDSKAASNAKVGFQDFLFKYPKSEKAAQARENLRLLDQKQTSSAFEIAKFYDKQKNYRAAVIYYNDVIRQEPGSTAGERAKRRVAQLRAKVGDAALQPAELTAATAKKSKKNTETAANGGTGSSAGRGSSGAPSMMHTSPSDVAPLPPPEADESLPPPASLTPDKTTAPPDAPPTPSASPTPEATASPEP